MSHKYYMQIHKNNLADYINKGIILPTQYLQNRTEDDIQSKNDNCILLSDGYFEELTDNQILLEIISTNEEIKLLDKIFLTVDTDNEIFISTTPLPITRISKIYVSSKAIIEKLESTFYTGDIGYLPNRKLEVIKKSFIKKLNRYKLDSISLKSKQIKWSKSPKYSKLEPHNIFVDNNIQKLLKYDKIMGMFSFMKNTNLYFSDRKKSVSNYSNNYFNLLSLLTSSINVKNSDDKQENFLKKLLQLEKPNTLISKLYADEMIDEIFIQKISETSNNRDTLYKLFDEMEKVEALESLKNTQDFYLAYLYFNRFDGDMESLKSKIVDIEDMGKVEILLAMFGLYYGYSKIRAREEIKIEDDVFKNLLIDKREKNIKFMLDSKLDYITIESIYQYVFNDKTSNEEFAYLEYPKKHKSIKIIETKKSKKLYNKEETLYFDVKKILITKKSWTETITMALTKYPKIITLKNPNLLAYMAEKGIKFDRLSMKEHQLTELSYKKEDIEEVIQTEKNEKERIEILEIFEKDGK